MKLHVEFVKRSGYADGGAYHLMKANGHTLAEMSQKGRHPLALCHAVELAARWNNPGNETLHGTYVDLVDVDCYDTPRAVPGVISKAHAVRLTRGI